MLSAYLTRSLKRWGRGCVATAGKFMSKEMTERGTCYGNYRFRRFQALDDGITLYFAIKDAKSWVTVEDICIALEWDEHNPSTRRRVRRICESLVRIKRVQLRGGHYKKRRGFQPLYYRAYAS